MAGLLLATSKRRGWWLAPVLAALSISLYGSGLAWALAIGLVLVWRILSGGSHSRPEVAPVIAASVLAVGVLVFPLYWWRGGKIIAGGGEPSYPEHPYALGHLSTELLRSGDSYYYFTDQPALGAWPLALLAGGGLVWCAARRPRVWPWLVVAISTLALYAVAGGVLGVRRAIAVSVIAGMGIGLFVDLLIKCRPAKKLLSASAGGRIGRTLVLNGISATLALLALLPLLVEVHSYGSALSAGRGHARLAMDFAFPIAKGETMTSTLDTVVSQRQAGVPWSTIAAQREGARTSAMLLLLQRRGKVPPGIVSGATVETLYREGRSCDSDCHPVPDRP